MSGKNRKNKGKSGGRGGAKTNTTSAAAAELETTKSAVLPAVLAPAAPTSLQNETEPVKEPDEETYWQEGEVQKFIHTAGSTASTMSLGDLSIVSAAPAAGPTAVWIRGEEVFVTANNPSTPVNPKASIMGVSFTSPTALFASNERNPRTTGAEEDVNCGAAPTHDTATWVVLQPIKRLLVQAIAFIGTVTAAVGIEKGMRQQIDTTLHHVVDHALSLPVLVLNALSSVLRAVFAFWWGWVVWWVSLPYRVTMFVAGGTWVVFASCLVMFLNRAPGGHRVLKALNGHLTRH
jgi:hypothetical protein